MDPRLGGRGGWSLSTPGSSQALKWLGFVTAVWVQSISGNNYTFANYSDAVKTLMGLTQSELNGLSVAKDIGKAFGLLAGLAADTFPTPVILLIGSVEGLVGYGAQWLVVSRTIRPLAYWQMCIFLCMGGNSTTWMNTAVLVTCIRNFRRNRGPVSGILKGYVGLSTAIFTDLCAALFSDSPSSFLLMLAVIPAVVCLSAMVFLREVPAEGEEEAKDGAPPRAPRVAREDETDYFPVFTVLAVVIALYLLAYDLLGKRYGSSGLVSTAFAVGLLVLLAAPLGVPLRVVLGRRKRSPLEEDAAAAEAVGPAAALTAPLLGSGNESGGGTNGSRPNGPTAAEEEAVEVAVGATSTNDRSNGKASSPKKSPDLGDEHTIKEVLATPEFWVLFVSFLCGVGTGMAVQNNMGQMGLALGYNNVSTFVSLISIFGFFGRIGSGTVSEHFLETLAIPRPLWNASSQILMAAGYIVMAMALPGSLYIGSIIVGLCYGVRLAITVPTASELFGLKYYGLIYNILILNLPLGSFLFSGLLAGLLYDAEATKTPDGGNYCVGAHCYRLVFLIMALTSVIGLGLDVLLVFKTKPLYAKIAASKRSRKRLSQ